MSRPFLNLGSTLLNTQAFLTEARRPSWNTLKSPWLVEFVPDVRIAIGARDGLNERNKCAVGVDTSCSCIHVGRAFAAYEELIASV